MWIERSAGWGNGVCSWGAGLGHNWGTAGLWFMGWVMPLLFWGLLLFVMITIIRQLTTGKRSGASDSSLEILQNRYARGEISEQQYRIMKSELLSS